MGEPETREVMAATRNLNRAASSPDRPQLTFVANPQSVHVAVWLKALAECGVAVRIESPLPLEAGTSAPYGATIEPLAPNWVPGIASLRYLWSGIAARLKRRSPGEFLHAHCTSGNGTVAWMSGHPYIVTTYGSEVILAHKRGRLYQWLIHRVLRRADRITATSQHMVDVLTQDHGIDRGRIHLFDLGLNTEVFHPLAGDDVARLRAEKGIGIDEPVWVSIKRAIPMNRTIEIVQAFEKYCDAYSHGRLVIICGDDVSAYSDRVKQQVSESAYPDRMIVLDKWLAPGEVAEWLQLADFALSVPISDQMSNAVLEAMACAAAPILLDVEGYGSLKDRGAQVHWLPECSVDSLTDAFRSSAGWSDDALTTRQSAAARFIDEHYANRPVRELLHRLYDLPALQDEVTLHAA